LSKGNKEVVTALKETVHSKEKTYDKIQAMMLEKCYDAITIAQCDKVGYVLIYLDP
jgi:hypothetical protein